MEPLQTVSSPISPLRPKSFTDARSRTSPIPQISISGRENIPPTHPNVPIDQRTSPSSRKKIPSIEAPTMRKNPRSDAPGVGSPDSSVKVPLIHLNSEPHSFTKILSFFVCCITLLRTKKRTTGETQISFHVVFFVYKNKI